MVKWTKSAATAKKPEEGRACRPATAEKAKKAKGKKPAGKKEAK